MHCICAYQSISQKHQGCLQSIFLRNNEINSPSHTPSEEQENSIDHTPTEEQEKSIDRNNSLDGVTHVLLLLMGFLPH